MKIDKTFEDRVWGRGSGTLICQFFSKEKPTKIDVSKKKPKIAYC